MLSFSIFFSQEKKPSIFLPFCVFYPCYHLSLASLSQKEERAGLLGPSQSLYPPLFAPIWNVLIILKERNTNEIQEKNSQDTTENHQRVSLMRIKPRTHCWKVSIMKTTLVNPPSQGRKTARLLALNNIIQTWKKNKLWKPQYLCRVCWNHFK